ncbi:uncharacterized protein KGF55_005663 [Candida pseudojiufengensis]|uniref:uncharacterized protein n=1 Tax=Candida pseudojiufengensis TaxID=497109 RepID=UPI0022250A83|nr:uncharacterized protein KGF55_005663 [Candida pseudojiufengensis]KAI5959009.1 hypothetical protein KGF55_005663 [Candida pseudojiufengensis]
MESSRKNSKDEKNTIESNVNQDLSKTKEIHKGGSIEKPSEPHSQFELPPNTLQSPYKENRKPPLQQSTSIPSLSMLNESIQRSSTNQSTPASPKKFNQTITDPGLLTLLGPNISSFPFSEDAFIETMKFKIEQERTKQEFYRAETTNKNLMILQSALQAQIPSSMIPQFISNVNSSNQQLNDNELVLQAIRQQTLQQQSQYQDHQRLQQQQQQQQQQQRQFQNQAFQVVQPHIEHQQAGVPHHLRQGQSVEYDPNRLQQEYQEQQQQISSQNQRPLKPFGLINQDLLNANPNSPAGFKFGAPSSTSQKRPLSPAKVGAAAVANLTTPTTPFRAPTSSAIPSSSSVKRTSRGHQRHYSMPTEVNTSGRNKLKRDLSNQTIDSNRTSSQVLQSPLGATTTLQVNPIPAQPLHKQNKSQVQPSQESMQSFQHVIQFHHWQPETGIQGSGSNTLPAHKRQKSISREASSSSFNATPKPMAPIKQNIQSTSNVKVEKVATPQQSREFLGENDDPDSSMDMDTSATNIDVTKGTDESVHPPSKSHSRQRSNVGRYPHNILSSNNK